MNIIAVIGSGGTGSYLAENLVNKFNLHRDSTKIMLIDGDILEEKNLERQAFFSDEVGMNKCDALKTRLESSCDEHVELDSLNDFINNARVFNKLFRSELKTPEEIRNFYIVSCVDNQYARIRMTLAVHVLHRYFERSKTNTNVVYVDSGNTEFTGQTIASRMNSKVSSGNEELKDFLDAVIDNKPYINKLKRAIKTFEGFDSRHELKTTFTSIEDWQNNLTKADHEVSCDVVAVSTPQNILVNQLASASILYSINSVMSGDVMEGMITVFNSKNFKIGLEQYMCDYSNFFKELLEWGLEEEGKDVLYNPKELALNS